MTLEELKAYAQELEERLENLSGREGWEVLQELHRVRRSIAAL